MCPWALAQMMPPTTGAVTAAAQELGCAVCAVWRISPVAGAAATVFASARRVRRLELMK
ncbi:hypothetical protein [Actinoallomurus acaciae]|uniref:Uncharacterized protein n=1 Tax=Actinoallomurus acaciae TaxID=502577 RepID=A0ABV5Y8U0_9ACTN